MNAYELADNFDTLGRLNDWAQQAQNMLRQQADRIAELEKENSELKYEKSSGVYDAEPVAWMLKKGLQNGLDDFFEHNKDFPSWQIEEFKEVYIPLYTTPQTKPLSFQEMVDCASEAGALWDTHINGDVIFKSVDAFHNFCRAIEKRILGK